MYFSESGPSKSQRTHHRNRQITAQFEIIINVSADSDRTGNGSLPNPQKASPLCTFPSTKFRKFVNSTESVVVLLLTMLS